MIRIAVVGTGMIAKEMLPVLTSMKELTVQVLCGTERSAELVHSLQKTYSIPTAFTSYETMLESEEIASVDIIYLATPNHTHYEMTLAALEHGKHVFLEKPFVTNIAEAEHLIRTARERKLFLVEAISNQYLAVYEKMRELLPALGEIKYIDCNFSQYSSRFDRFAAGEYFRVFDPACAGGALMDLNVYNIHLIAGLFGAPASVSYHANLMRGVDTSGVLYLRYPDFQCTSTAAKDSQGPSRILIQGVRGYLQVTAPTNSMNAPLEYYDQKTKTLQKIEFPLPSHRMVPEFQAMCRMLETQDYEQCLSRQEESLLVCRILTEAKTSMKA